MVYKYIMSVVEFTSNISLTLKECKEYLKIPNFIDGLYERVSDIMKNLNDDITNIHETYETTQSIKLLYVEESFQIISKLSLFIFDYISKNPYKYINIDTSSGFFSCSQTEMLWGKPLPNIFITDKVSKLIHFLTIICKVIDIVNTYFITELHTGNRMILGMFKSFYLLCKPIHSYFLEIFNTNNSHYLSHIPISIMNIFTSALIFIEDDDETHFLKFIVEYYEWVPNEFRCKYLLCISELLSSSNVSPNIKFVVRQFNPSIKLLIDDVNYSFKKYLKEPQYIKNIININHFISVFLKNGIHKSKSSDEYSSDDLIYFISAQLTIFSKINDEKNKEQNPDVIDEFEKCIIRIIECIYYVIHKFTYIINSYLIYYIPFILFDYYMILPASSVSSVSASSGSSLLDNLFLLISDKLLIKYICSMKERSVLLQINHSFIKRFEKEINHIYDLFDKIEQSNIIDELSGCFIIKPAYIPSGNIVDEYIFCVTLWSTPINPYDRSPLSIQQFIEFNKTPISIKAVEDFKQRNKIHKKIKVSEGGIGISAGGGGGDSSSGSSSSTALIESCESD